MNRFNICWNERDCDKAYQWLAQCDLIANDIETIPFRKQRPANFLMTVSAFTGLASNGKLASFAFPWVKAKSPTAEPVNHLDAVYNTVKRINALPLPMVLHNGVYDAYWYLYYDMPIQNYAYDTMTMWWSRFPDMPRTLDFVSSILLDHHQFWKQGRKDTDMVLHMIYAMRDTESTLLSCTGMFPWLLKDKSTRINFFYAHLRCLTGLAMSVRGLRIVPERIEEMRVELQAEADKRLEELRYLVADEEFNPNSPKQKAELFYKLLGAKPRNAKGRLIQKAADIPKASSGEFAMRAIAGEHPIFNMVIKGIRAAQVPKKQISNVVQVPHRKNRFHSSMDGVGTTTSRFASRADAFGFGTNSQNLRKKFRTFARADADSFLLEVDFSAADDVFVSYESEEQKKIEVIEKGLDTHSFNAAEIFFTNWTYDGIVDGKAKKDDLVVHPISGIRQITKKVTHGCNYLMAAMTLLSSAGRDSIIAAAIHHGHEDAKRWSQQQLLKFCEELDIAYRNYYPRFRRSNKSFYADLQREVQSTGGFMTIFNYHQRFFADASEDSTLRAIAATSGQANTAGRVNMAMLELDQGVRIENFRDGPAPDIDEPTLMLDEYEHGATIRLQTHDSCTFNILTKAPKWEEGVRRILHVMQRPVVCKGREIRVGIEADVSLYWSGKEGIQVHNVDDVIAWVEKNRHTF